MKTYEIIKSPLYNLQSRKKMLQECLGLHVTYKELNELIKNTEDYYKEFELTKIKDGKAKTREIKQPINTLKVIHKKLARLLARITPPDYLQSKKGTSYKENALRHLGHDYVITLDIQNFFPSCKRERIAKSLSQHFKMAGDIAYILSKLISFNEIIPQGSNTSTVIAFWSNLSMFEEINHYCKIHQLNFTLFVDDITISSNIKIDLKHYDHIVGILKKNGFKVKYSKTKYFKKNQPKHITGIVNLDDHIDIEFKKRKVFFEELNKKYPSHKDQLSIAGRYNSLKYLKEDFCPTLKNKLRVKSTKKKAISKVA